MLQVWCIYRESCGRKKHFLICTRLILNWKIEEKDSSGSRKEEHGNVTISKCNNITIPF